MYWAIHYTKCGRLHWSIFTMRKSTAILAGSHLLVTTITITRELIPGVFIQLSIYTLSKVWHLHICLDNYSSGSHIYLAHSLLKVFTPPSAHHTVMIIITSLSKITSHGISYGKQPFVDEHMWCRVRISPKCTHIIILQLV